jgi:hypothetical protein
MPSGISSVSEFQSRRREEVLRPSLLLRVRTYLMRRHLDAHLAAGADPGASAPLRLRAQRLCSDDERTRVADKLQRVIDEARGLDPARFVLQPHRAEIRAQAADLEDLIDRLRDERPVAARGAAMAARLVTRGESPFDANRRVGVADAVRAAHKALDEPGAREAIVAVAA